jgi:aminopeptidase YwaD
MRLHTLCVLLLFVPTPLLGQANDPAPLLSKGVIAALAEEASGESAKRNLEFISTQHRMRDSRGFRAAANHILGKLREYGFQDAKIVELPADGKIFYGTQRSRPAWDVEFAQLWEVTYRDGQRFPATRLADWDSVPLSLAQDSESGEAEGELVDVGSGTTEDEYRSKDVRGKFVLVSAQGEAVVPLAIARFGALGIVSYAPNQRTAWSGDNPDQVRWGHLDTFSPTKAFAFMISPRKARELQARLLTGDKVRLHGVVRAGKHPGAYAIAMASIQGSDRALRSQEILLTCHLDHPRPGANDNASGCVTILEVARIVSNLVRSGKLEPPRRTIRFLWPMEIEGSIAYLNAHPEWAQTVKANIHLDMVGGSPETKAVFHVTRGPASVPSFINDVSESLAQWVNQQTYQFAATGDAEFPLIAPDGGKEPIRADPVPFTMGSDHQVYASSPWAIPTIYFNDWPDRNIHTTSDTPAMIDTTKLKRAAFMAAANAYLLAQLTPADAEHVIDIVRQRSLLRAADTLQQARSLNGEEKASLLRFKLAYEEAMFTSLERFFAVPPTVKAEASAHASDLRRVLRVGPDPAPSPTGNGALVFKRNSEPHGPMTGFGHDYFEEKYGRERAAKLQLLKHQGLRGAGPEYAYEVLNFVDGRRPAREIRDAVSAIYGPVPLGAVVEYLRALEEIGVLERLK